MNKCPICFTTGKYHRKDCPNNTEFIIIKTETEYNNIKIKVEELGKEIGDNWYIKEEGKLIPNKQYEKQINEHQRLASSMLGYEVENNLLPI
jgi:hypothetical protein